MVHNIETLIGSQHPKAKFSAQRDLFAPRDKGQITRGKVRRQMMREKNKGATEGGRDICPREGSGMTPSGYRGDRQNSNL